MMLKYYKNQPVPENNVVVCITTQQALFNANWNDDEFCSQMIADIVQKLQECEVTKFVLLLAAHSQ